MPLQIIDLDIDLSLPSHEGKFVQFRQQGKEYLIFSRTITFHVAILSVVLDKWNIPHRFKGENDIKYLGSDDPQIEIMGGGRFKINVQEKTLTLYGKSEAFGPFREAGLVEQIARSDHPFAKLIVTVRPGEVG